MPATEAKKSSAPLIGLIVIVLALAAGATYLWTQKPPAISDPAPEVTNQQEEAAPVSESDEVDSIQADLDATVFSEDDFSSFEAELDAQ
jgi:flagellar basal body-associated protein FliL